jgi:hypothetical protein
MNIDEADAIIAELNICFPGKQLLVEEVKRWEGNLAPFHYDDAKRAVKHIEDTSKFWPSWSEFREAIMPMHKERLWIEKERREREQRQLMPARTPEETARIQDIIQGIKENLSKRA